MDQLLEKGKDRINGFGQFIIEYWSSSVEVLYSLYVFGPEFALWQWVALVLGIYLSFSWRNEPKFLKSFSFTWSGDFLEFSFGSPKI